MYYNSVIARVISLVLKYMSTSYDLMRLMKSIGWSDQVVMRRVP